MSTYIPPDVMMNVVSFGTTRPVIPEQTVYEYILDIHPFFNLQDILTRLSIWVPTLKQLRSDRWYTLYQAIHKGRASSINYSALDRLITINSLENPTETMNILNTIYGFKSTLRTYNITSGSPYYDIEVRGDYTLEYLYSYLLQVNGWEGSYPLRQLYFNKESQFEIKSNYERRLRVSVSIEFNKEVYAEIQKLDPSFSLNRIYVSLLREERILRESPIEKVNAAFLLIRDWDPTIRVSPNGFDIVLSFSEYNEDTDNIAFQMTALGFVYDGDIEFNYTEDDAESVRNALVLLLQREFAPPPPILSVFTDQFDISYFS